MFPFYVNNEPPQNFLCKGHTQKVAAIDWFDDDMGLVSASLGGEVYQWDLINTKENARITDLDFTLKKNVKITSAVNIPNRKHEFFCVGSDKLIHHNAQQNEPYEAQAVLK